VTPSGELKAKTSQRLATMRGEEDEFGPFWGKVKLQGHSMSPFFVSMERRYVTFCLY